MEFARENMKGKRLIKNTGFKTKICYRRRAQGVETTRFKRVSN